MFIKIWQYSQENTLLESLFDKIGGLKAYFFYWKRDTNTGIFLWILRIIENSFFIEHLLLIILFRNFYVMIEFFGRLWVQNWYFSYFLCHYFIFFHNSSVRIGTPWLFCICIYTKMFSKYNFRTHYNVGIRNRNNIRIIATSPGNLLWKTWIWAFWILCFAIIFLYKLFCKDMVKNNPTEKQIDAEIQATLKHGPAWKLKVYRYKL